METQSRAWPPWDVVGSEALTRKVQGHGKDMLAGRGWPVEEHSSLMGAGETRDAWRVGGAGGGCMHGVGRLREVVV